MGNNEILMELEKELEETRRNAEICKEALNEKLSCVESIVSGHFGAWVDLVNDSKNVLESKGFKPNLPASIIVFANERRAFLNKKKEYISQCVLLVDDIQSHVSADSEKLAEAGAVLSSIANSLGFTLSWTE